MSATSAVSAVGAVAAGGALGSLARHGVNIAIAQMTGRPEPYATAAVNILGSGVIGALAGLIASGRLTTTFSSLMLDTLTLTHANERTLAMSNVIGQTVIGLVVVYAAYYAAAR